MNSTYQSRPLQAANSGPSSMAQLGNAKAAMGKTNLGGAGSSSQGAKLSQNPHMIMAMTSGGSAYQPPGLQNQKANFHSQKKFLNQMGKVSTKNSQNPNTQGSQNRTGKLHNKVPSETMFFVDGGRGNVAGKKKSSLTHGASKAAQAAHAGASQTQYLQMLNPNVSSLSPLLFQIIRALHRLWLVQH